MSDQLPISDETLLRLRRGNPEELDTLAHLVASNPVLGERLAEWERQDAALATLYNHIAEEVVPARHRALIAAASTQRHVSFNLLHRIAAAIALLAFGAAMGWFAALKETPGTSGTELASAALRAYATFAVEVAHPVEVHASDEPHLETWLSRRIGQPIIPPDLSSDGFHLLGGRVVPDVNGTAALLMYENDLGQRVTFYVAPSPSDAETALRFASSSSARGFWWVENQLGCALVGDLPRDALRRISLNAYEQIDPV